MDAAIRHKIISAFGAHLETRKSVFGCESELPYPKEIVRQALAEELVGPTTPELVDAMEGFFLLLEDFVSDEEAAVAHRYDLFLARGLRLKQSGDIEAAGDLAREGTEVSGPYLALQNRTLLLVKARQQQLLKMRALRQAETKAAPSASGATRQMKRKSGNGKMNRQAKIDMVLTLILGLAAYLALLKLFSK